MSIPKTHPLRIQQQEDQSKALALRIAGKSYKEIAAEVGCGVQTAYSRVISALKKRAKERNHRAELVLALEQDRLDEMWAAIYLKIKSGDLKAIETGLRIMERRAKYDGLDAPTKSEVMVGLATLTDAELVNEARKIGIAVPEELIEQTDKDKRPLALGYVHGLEGQGETGEVEDSERLQDSCGGGSENARRVEG